MKTSQKLAVRASELRQRLNELAGIEALDDSQRGELDTLTAEYATVELRYRAALTGESDALETATAEPPADGEVRERLELMGRARVGRYAAAALVAGPWTASRPKQARRSAAPE